MSEWGRIVLVFHKPVAWSQASWPRAWAQLPSGPAARKERSKSHPRGWEAHRNPVLEMPASFIASQKARASGDDL